MRLCGPVPDSSCLILSLCSDGHSVSDDWSPLWPVEVRLALWSSKVEVFL